MSYSQPQTLAAVDLGSNSFHMIVAKLADQQLQIVDRLREPVRLAAGLSKDNELDDDSKARAIAALGRFSQRLRDFSAEQVRVVGTNTLRKAKNSDAFIEDAESHLGYPIEIIAGLEEARLVYLGAAHASPQHDGNRLVLDIGGGSTEIIVGENTRVLQAASVYMGCVSMSQRYFSNGLFTTKQLKRARRHIDSELDPFAARFKSYGLDFALGCSGTIRAVAKVLRVLEPDNDAISRKSLNKLIKSFIKVGSVEALSLQQLSPERLPVFSGGIVILERAMDTLGIDSMRISSGALREGLLYDLFGRVNRDDARDVSVQALMQRYQVDTVQAKRVESLALYLLQQVKQEWGFADDGYAQKLSWAAQLHELGISVARSRYQMHGAYIISQSDLPGFSKNEQAVLACLVANHRRRPKYQPERNLSKPWAQAWPKIVSLLRIAFAFHRSHSDIELPRITLKARDEALTMDLPSGWLNEHPLTLDYLTREKHWLQQLGLTFRF